MTDKEPTYANGKICYVELPARDVAQSAEFYRKVLGWKIRTRGDGSTAFDDGVGQVSGAWRTDRKVVAEIGMLIHIMVADIQKTISLVEANGGKIVRPVGLDAPEVTAWFSDPAGNVLGLYEQKGLK